MSFADLGLSDELLRAVADAGYDTPTPIQEKAIPNVLMGRDIMGCAQTGTGKTASFTLPMLDILSHGRAKARMPRSLILEPTRELAAQVADNFETYGKYQRLSKALLIGGESMAEQIKSMDNGVDELIATPGRLLDLFDRGRLLLNDVKILVIDEADRMLDMGFIPDVERIVSLLPKMRNTLMFSATMPREIRRLSEAFLMNPKEITVAAPSSTAATIIQGLVTLKRGSAQKEKREKLRELIKRDDAKNGIVFCNRKRDVSVVCRSMERHGFNVGQLHGDMSQPARMETLAKFKGGNIQFLVCSDVAARGLDIPAMSHVFNFDVPTHAEDYVHRIGRTGRAGREGHAYTIALSEDSKYVAAIEKLSGKPIPPLGAAKVEAKDTAEPTNAESANTDDAIVVAPAADKEDKPKNPRNRGRDRGARKDAATESAPAETALEKVADAPKKEEPISKTQQKKSSRRERERAREKELGFAPDDLPSDPVKGLGDNAPSFFLNAFPGSKSTSK
ncbi:MAG: DEAD/DEAH box helicase [Rhodospirillales bacterium]|nr:DEAD/DEAH box helicase [Rhodospirillales bacterium]